MACGEKDVKNWQLRQELHENFNGLVCNWETPVVLSVANLNRVIQGKVLRIIKK